ncbi:fumarylacetoacetate hydrolase family protein [Lacisediminimonas sp.]|uniref:fumarylacetoacetate hydrolase family protein n=1 Tax=Lacisediminimonas sp. TaxID=3060582 RepID=UPI00271FF04C|nr:fumarylacetoacetate hydrolase family protein [Lacisediminimonas sp.]MDO8298180.1 fumarylacetoacetate hydrolase family protein [Lacisediminimonas sp.]
MRFATIELNGAPTVAIVSRDGKQYWPMDEVLPGFKGDMVDLIRAVPNPQAQLKTSGEGKSLDGIRILAPIRNPRRNVFLVGKNYHEHAKEFNQSGFDGSKEDAPPLPSIFTKPGSTIVGPNDPVFSHPQATKEVDYENEFTVIIGQGGRGISKADAYSHVWGYTIVNDVTARDLQKQARQWFLGKALDAFLPMGPVIVTPDEIDPENLQLKTWINGELRQNANTGDLIFDIPTIIEVLSAGMALEAGDIIATGTAAGVGIGFKPPKFLKPGDEMKLEIEGIGTLFNRMV